MPGLHITQAVEAMDGCFALTGAHQHGIAVGSMKGEASLHKLVFFQSLYLKMEKGFSKNATCLWVEQLTGLISLSRSEFPLTRTSTVSKEKDLLTVYHLLSFLPE